MGKILAYVGSLVAATSTVACAVFFFFDEPEMPKSLIEK